MADHLYLVPGFFGFADLGGMRYFGPVVEHLAVEAPEVVVHKVATHPTASLRLRARRLADAVRATSEPGDRVHLIGHSSGGLDARLLTTPGVVLPDVDDVEDIASRVVSVVGVATPSHGTPSAEFFATLAGKRLLRLLSLATVLILRRGALPLSVFVALADLARRGTDKVIQSDPAMVDHVFDELLAELTDDRRTQVLDFFAEVGDDQGLLTQIGPDALQLFNTTTADRPGVRYGSVITRARRPDISGAWLQGLNPTAQSAYASFALMHALAGRGSTTPELTDAQRTVLTARWPDGLTAADNDGMVPTLAQPWGEVIRCLDGDHLDVCGHYADPTAVPPRYDWFSTGSGMTRDRFEATWTDVAHFCFDD